MIAGFEQNIDLLHSKLSNASFYAPVASIIEAYPTRIITSLQTSFVGEICNIHSPGSDKLYQAQTVAIEDGKAILAPLQDISGLSSDAEVIPTGLPFKIHVGDALLGRVLDGLGEPLDERPLDKDTLIERDVAPQSISPMDRPIIDKPLQTGIRSLDAFTTLGQGQRVSVLGDPGSGKTTLLSMLARNADADVCILVLIGERGREIRELLDRQLPPEFREKCVVVASTSEKPAMERLMASHLGLAIAEYFRDQGKHVLLMFDSVTRFARAQREVSLAAGEPVVRRGYTSSVYTELPRLVERCGRTNKGAISAIFTVLTESEGIGDPIAEELTSLTDGHIILSPKLGQAGHFPAVDVLRSRSRLMSELVDSEHQNNANKIRDLMGKYNEVELLIQVGEYKKGSDLKADEAIAKHDAINTFLQQAPDENSPLDKTTTQLKGLAGNE